MTDKSFVSRGILWQNKFYAKVPGFDEPDDKRAWTAQGRHTLAQVHPFAVHAEKLYRSQQVMGGWGGAHVKVM